MHHISRRDVLTAAAGTAVFAGRRPSRAADRVNDRPESLFPKRVIFAVSDGMSTGTLTLTDVYAQRQLGRRTAWMSLIDRPDARRALCSTHSANSFVTDSAAASTAWSVGQKANNGAICVMPDGSVPEPIMMRAKQRGLATGLVTTTRVTHATPAAFIANVPKRDMEGIIAEQTIDRQPDVVLGGGSKFFPQELIDNSGYQFVSTADQLNAARTFQPGDQLLGLFTKSHLGYVLDRTPDEPSLADMTKAALRLLDQHDNGFLLQVEGGRVDHAAHGNDAPSLIHEQLDFDDALAALIEYTKGRDDTLLIATSDHGNANPGSTLYGEQGHKGLDRISAARQSFDWINEQLLGRSDPFDDRSVVREVVEHATGVALDDDEMDILVKSTDERVDPFDPANRMTSVLGSILANHFGIAFVSPNHTADYVEVTAIGTGAGLLPPVMDNTTMANFLLPINDATPALPRDGL